MIPINNEHLDKSWKAFQDKAEEIYALFPDLSKFDLEVKIFNTKEWGDCMKAHDYDLLDAIESRENKCKRCRNITAPYCDACIDVGYDDGEMMG